MSQATYVLFRLATAAISWFIFYFVINALLHQQLQYSRAAANPEPEKKLENGGGCLSKREKFENL